MSVSESSGNRILGLVVGLVVVLIVIAFLLPVGISNFYNANWTTITGIDASVANMINTIIPVMVVLGIVLAIIDATVQARRG